MELKQYLRVFRERWTFLAVGILLAMLLAGIYTFLQTPEYSAATQLFVSTSGDRGGNAQDAYQGGLFGQQRVKSYAEIVSSQPVVERVKQDLQLPETTDKLRKEITASAPLDTVLVNVTVTDSSPTRAAAIADDVGRQFAERVNELETPQGGAVSPVKVSVAQPPSVPSHPTSPRRTLDMLVGSVVGLVLGGGVAVFRAATDTRIGDVETLSSLVDGPVLGGFRDDPLVRERPLLLDVDPYSPRSEGFRQLRTNIRFLAVDAKIRALVVTSSLPGEGKTTIACNLAIVLAQAGEEVILVDADLRRPSVGDLMGVNPQHGLTNVLLDAISLDSALQPYRGDQNLRVLSSGPTPPNPSELLGSQRMRQITDALKQRSSIVIFDSPPLLPVTDAAVLSLHTDGALVIARAGKTHRHELKSSLESLRQVGGHIFGAVFNRLPARGSNASYAYSYSYRPRSVTNLTPTLSQEDDQVTETTVR